MTTKAGVNESVPTVTESNGGEKDTSVESEEKENLKEPGDKETESAKPDKEAEEKSSVSSEILGITCVTKTGTLQQKFKTAHELKAHTKLLLRSDMQCDQYINRRIRRP
jgi:hypothetical protein